MLPNNLRHLLTTTPVRCLTGFVLILGFAATAGALGNQQALDISVSSVDGSYSIADAASGHTILTAAVSADVDGKTVRSSEYPKHAVTQSTTMDDLGTAKEWIVTFSGLAGKPDLIYHLRAYPDKPFADIQVTVHNGTAQAIHVENIRVLEAAGGSILDLGGPADQDRVLSDSFSEDRPALKVHDLADAENHMHRGVGSQLVYNRVSHTSFFAGALTSDRFITVLRIHLASASDRPTIASWEVDSTGTTELLKEYSLKESPADDQVYLHLEVPAGADLPSERLLLSVDSDYHRQLETYGSLIRQIHHARFTSPALLGWWSWIPYYFGLNEGAALTEAQWLSEYLKPLGYNYFVMDEGYQYARGEYATPNAALFPHGVANFEWKVSGLGLVPGIWTAPFEVTERSWVYEHHPDWLVHNAKGEPIHAGWVDEHKDQIYALDPTNPGAQDYLRQTYSTLVNQWGLRYIKMDFMEDSGVEGYFYRPNTTAMEAQRIGWTVIRQAVGNDVLLDKDGCEMLNPVGYFDSGRISQDTSNEFSSTKAAASGIAARYYMNRNFYVDDPDAFSVTHAPADQKLVDRPRSPLTLDEAKTSIAMAAVSGGMFEIGDDLPTLGSQQDRLALVTNKDLIEMVKLGRSSVPLDLLNYSPEDEQPSIFVLKEDARQTMLSIFNWTDGPRSHTVSLSDLGLKGTEKYAISDVLDNKKAVHLTGNSLVIGLPAHSVRLLKLIDTSVPASAPVVHAEHGAAGKTGEPGEFSALASGPETAVVSYQWDFGDGVKLTGRKVSHTYTRPGTYTVGVTATGLDGLEGKDSFSFPVNGVIATHFSPSENKRYEPEQ